MLVCSPCLRPTGADVVRASDDALVRVSWRHTTAKASAHCCSGSRRLQHFSHCAWLVARGRARSAACVRSRATTRAPYHVRCRCF
eukprot:5114319-Prymnesium_polylepis.1